jgi:hypothetical protein
MQPDIETINYLILSCVFIIGMLTGGIISLICNKKEKRDYRDA